jgi:YfiR/HmsC-like
MFFLIWALMWLFAPVKKLFSGANNKALSYPYKEVYKRRALLPLLLFLAVITPLSTAQVTSPLTREYQLKAAFLYNFTKFINWPPESLGNSPRSFNFCVTGLTPLAQALEQFIQGKKVHGRKPVLKYISNAHHLAGCHVLFISQAKQESIPGILDAVAGDSVLTVGETKNFTSQGGMIEFLIAANKLRFEINLQTAKSARLGISSQLLKLAVIVHEE